MSKVLPLPGTLRVELSELILLSVCMPVILVQLRGKRPVYPLKSKRKLRLHSRKSRGKPEESRSLTLKPYGFIFGA